MKQPEIIEVFRACDLFSVLNETELARVAAIANIETFGPGDRIFSQGESPGRIYVIAEGVVRLERTVDLGGRRAIVMVDLLGPGRTLGCWPELLGETHPVMCSAVCARAGTLISVEGRPLRELVSGDKDFGFRVLERLSRILRSRIAGIYGAMEKL